MKFTAKKHRKSSEFIAELLQGCTLESMGEGEGGSHSVVGVHKCLGNEGIPPQ